MRLRQTLPSIPFGQIAPSQSLKGTAPKQGNSSGPCLLDVLGNGPRTHPLPPVSPKEFHSSLRTNRKPNIVTARPCAPARPACVGSGQHSLASTASRPENNNNQRNIGGQHEIPSKENTTIVSGAGKRPTSRRAWPRSRRKSRKPPRTTTERSCRSVWPSSLAASR